MTKKEYIKRYGAEWYEMYKTKMKEHQNEPEFKEHHKTKRREYHKERYNVDEEYTLKYRLRKGRRYVKDGRVDLIENYDLAKADNFKDWDIHHKLEVNNDYINTVNDLKLMNLYYDRPPEELIWLTNSEHHALHMKMRNLKK